MYICLLTYMSLYNRAIWLKYVSNKYVCLYKRFRASHWQKPHHVWLLRSSAERETLSRFPIFRRDVDMSTFKKKTLLLPFLFLYSDAKRNRKYHRYVPYIHALVFMLIHAMCGVCGGCTIYTNISTTSVGRAIKVVIPWFLIPQVTLHYD